MCKRGCLTECIYGFVIAVVYCLGKTIYETTDFRGIAQNPAKYALLFLGVGIVSAMALGLLDLLLKKAAKIRQWQTARKVVAGRWAFLVLWIILAGVYFICYVSYYPGTFAYDAPPQTYQAYGYDPLNTHHPVLHTLAWRVCLIIGSCFSGMEQTVALAVYSVSELLVVVTVSMVVVYTVYKLTDNIYALTAGYLYYLLTPVLPVMSFSMTKDILFSCFFIVFLIMLHSAQSEVGKKQEAALFLTGLLACLFRNNMIYVMLLVLLAAFIMKYAKCVKRILCMIVVTYYVIMKLIFPLAGVESGERSEAFPVILTQMSGIYVNYPELLTEEEKQVLLDYIPDAEMFNRHFADYVKNSFNETLYKEDSKPFWKTYLSIVKKAPLESFCIFLDLNVDYWYPNAESPDPYSNREYIETDTQEREVFWVDNAGLLPKIHGFYEQITGHEHWLMQLPGIRYFYSLAFPFMSLVVCVYLIIKNRRADCVLAFTALIGLFLTFLLGPVSNFRYIYIYYVALPLYFCYAAHGTTRGN